MDILIIIVVMVVVGLLIGYFADKIFKGERPGGVSGDIVAAVISTVVVALMDWYVIPAMGFSDTIKLVGVVLEPPLAALIVLWIWRKARQ